jgi:hypothetical protein
MKPRMRPGLGTVCQHADPNFEFLTANSGSSFVAEAIRVIGRGALTAVNWRRASRRAAGAPFRPKTLNWSKPSSIKAKSAARVPLAAAKSGGPAGRPRGRWRSAAG